MYRRGIKLPTAKEERVAIAIGKIISDYSLDLEAVGKYLAISNPYLIYSRAVEILESAQYNKEVAEYREYTRSYGSDKLF